MKSLKDQRKLKEIHRKGYGFYKSPNDVRQFNYRDHVEVVLSLLIKFGPIVPLEQNMDTNICILGERFFFRGPFQLVLKLINSNGHMHEQTKKQPSDSERDR